MDDVIEQEFVDASALHFRRREREGVAGQFLASIQRQMEEPRVAGLGDLRGDFLRGGRGDEQETDLAGGGRVRRQLRAADRIPAVSP